MTDKENKKYPKTLYIADPELQPPMDEGAEEETYCAYENAEQLCDKDDELQVAVYKFSGTIKVKNETTVIE